MPAASPYRNAVKHVWDEFGRRARKNDQINTLQDLQTALNPEWRRQALPNAFIQQYVNSLYNGGQGGLSRYSARCWDHSQATSMENMVNVPGPVMYYYPIFS